MPGGSQIPAWHGVENPHRRVSTPYRYQNQPGGNIASVGQTEAQAPHSVHLSGSIQRIPFFSLIASTGHSGSHAPQFTQASVILYAMTLSSQDLMCRVDSGNRSLPEWTHAVPDMNRV